MTRYEKESGVEIEFVERDKQSKYPFKSMEVGDSFFIPSTADCEKPWVKKGSNAWWAGKRYGMKFSVRKQRDAEGNVGARIIRTA